MSRFTKEYIEATYVPITLLSEGERSKVEIVKDPEGGLAVKKTIYGSNMVYRQLRDRHHRGLANIIHLVLSDSETIVIEEYLSGITLQQRLDQNRPFQQSVLHNWMTQLAEILVFIHSHNIIHRDIKPANIIISGDGVVKLIDFDSARNYQASQSNDTVYLGTKGYAAPEQYGYAQTDARSDIYSFGVLYHQLLTGQLTERATPNAELQHIINRCTQIDPAHRYPNAYELLKDLTACESSLRSVKKAAGRQGRIGINFNAGRIWRLLVLAIYIALIIYSCLIDKNNASVNRIYLLFSYLWVFTIPVLYPLDILAIRTKPVIPLFQREHHPILYGFFYYLFWLFALIVIFIVMELLTK